MYNVHTSRVAGLAWVLVQAFSSTSLSFPSPPSFPLSFPPSSFPSSLLLLSPFSLLSSLYSSPSGPLGRIAWRLPSLSELPLCDYSFRQFFELLGVRNVLKLVTCILLEHQLLLKSSGKSWTHSQKKIVYLYLIDKLLSPKLQSSHDLLSLVNAGVTLHGAWNCSPPTSNLM